MYTAINSADKIKFNQLHKGCGQRIKQKLTCPIHGDIERADIVKGYEYETDRYVVLDDADFEKVRLETTSTIELIQFIQAEELNSMHVDTPYYIGPDGPVAEDGFCVLAEAMRRAKRIALGRVVMSGKEKLVAVKPFGSGLLLVTLRYAAEIRDVAPYFGELKNREVDQEQVALAQRLIESKAEDRARRRLRPYRGSAWRAPSPSGSTASICLGSGAGLG